jgi:hypothetical protein
LAALARIAGNGVSTIVVEPANRFAHDLMVQEVGFGPTGFRAWAVSVLAQIAGWDGERTKETRV